MSELLNIPYIPGDDPEFHSSKHLLDLFYPSESEFSAFPILVFIHGGTWMHGNKDPFAILGRNMTDCGIMTVNINYRLGDLVNFQKMAFDCAMAIKWVIDNTAIYGGDPEKIALSGHSAGGHLAALVGLNSSYFDQINAVNKVNKVLLIDAFGLNIGSLIKKYGTELLNHMEKIFSNNPETWKAASPLSFINNRNIPFFILIGSRSYPALIADNEYFAEKLKEVNENVSFYEVPGKSHLEMVTQLQKKDNPVFRMIADFVKG